MKTTENKFMLLYVTYKKKFKEIKSKNKAIIISLQNTGSKITA